MKSALGIAAVALLALSAGSAGAQTANPMRRRILIARTTAGQNRLSAVAGAATSRTARSRRSSRKASRSAPWKASLQMMPGMSMQDIPEPRISAVS